MSATEHSLLPAEARLVFLTACGEWADPLIVDSMGKQVDWSSVLAIATREHACAAAAGRFARLGAPPAASSALDALRQQGAVEAFRMALLEERLERLMARFGEAGVDFVLLKGSAIALRYLGGLKARPMGDLDVLVRPERATAAHELALELGWVLRKGVRAEMYVGMPHLPPLVAGDGLGFGLEIHTALFPDEAPFRFSPEDLWRSATRLPRAGRPATPDPEHLLVHACLHFAWSHRFRRGTWRTVRDLDALSADPALRPDHFARLVKYARGETCVYWTCALFEEITGRALPVVPAHGPQIRRGPLHASVLRHLVLEAAYAPDAPGTRQLARMLWTLAVRPRASGHGSARPWKRDEGWLDPPEEGTAEHGKVGDRFSGFLAYARRVCGFEPGGRSAGA
jgi:hypothetical protein